MAAPGFADAEVEPTGAEVQIVLRPATLAESVVVTATRGAERLPSASSATVVTAAELSNIAAGAMDDVLRNTPGFSLFRRSSSRVANPTTQGVTLRGVSGSGASRTLVLADGIPLNDPFGSWVYWNRVPQAAVDRVEVVRGATGDLYGADALGGVVQVLTFAPDRTRARATIEGGSLDTFRGSLFGGWRAQRLGRDRRLRGHRRPTAPYTVAPEARGPVDTRPTAITRPGSSRPAAQRHGLERLDQGRALQRGSRQRHAAAGEHHRLAPDLGHGRRIARAAACGRRTWPAAARTTTRRSPPSPPIAPASG